MENVWVIRISCSIVFWRGGGVFLIYFLRKTSDNHLFKAPAPNQSSSNTRSGSSWWNPAEFLINSIEFWIVTNNSFSNLLEGICKTKIKICQDLLLITLKSTGCFLINRVLIYSHLGFLHRVFSDFYRKTIKIGMRWKEVHQQIFQHHSHHIWLAQGLT